MRRCVPGRGGTGVERGREVDAGVSVHAAWATGTFKLSEDLLFIEKVGDVLGLYRDPLDPAMVCCVDQKSGIRALDRTQPILSMRPGQVERGIHHYRRNGLTDLFAALHVATGQVVSTTRRRHRAAEF